MTRTRLLLCLTGLFALGVATGIGLQRRWPLGRVRDELRSMISYRPLNLLDSGWSIRGPFHAIFCRNVMIYFDKQTQYGILQKFVPLLRPDGLLFTGHSESFHHAANLFSLRGKTVYELANPVRTAHH